MRKEFYEPRNPMKVGVFLGRFEAFNKERKKKKSNRIAKQFC